MITLYIAGPMTGHDDYNRPAFHQAAAQLRGAGYHVISPAETPQSTAAPEWADWTRASLKRMLDADAVATLPGWQTSRGARLEIHVAAQLGMDQRSLAYWLDRAWIHAPRSHDESEKFVPHFSIHKDGRIEQHLPSSTGEDQAQRTPPPIPAATAAAATIGHITLDALLGVHPGTACCTDGCCGPGSYCCTHPENAPHTHPELEEEHRHLYISGRPDCVECGATDPNLGHYPDDDTNTGPTRQEDK